MLMLHVDHFRSTITKKGRLKVVESYNPHSKTTQVDEAYLPAADEIAKLASQLKVNTIVLHPFADLFADLSRPDIAVETLKLTEGQLVQRGFKVIRTPFGSYSYSDDNHSLHPDAKYGVLFGF